jgi:hypothetical protein
MCGQIVLALERPTPWSGSSERDEKPTIVAKCGAARMFIITANVTEREEDFFGQEG